MDTQQPDIELQKRLSQPVVDPRGMTSEDEAFLNMIEAKVESKEIDLMRPSSLINQPLYDTLTEELQGKVDFDAVSLCMTLRTIHEQWQVYKTPTFEIKSLVHQVRLTKERLEEIEGDVYTI